MVGWYLALAASQQSSVRLLQFAPKFAPIALECLDANHSFSFRLGLQAADCSIQLFSLRRYNRYIHTIDLPYLRMFHHKAGLSTM